MRVRENTISILPGELASHPFLSIDELVGFNFDLLNKIRYLHHRLKPNEQVAVIRHAIDSEQLRFSFGNEAIDVAVDFFFVRRSDKVRSVPYRKNKLEIDLTVGVSHD